MSLLESRGSRANLLSWSGSNTDSIDGMYVPNLSVLPSIMPRLLLPALRTPDIQASPSRENLLIPFRILLWNFPGVVSGLSRNLFASDETRLSSCCVDKEKGYIDLSKVRDAGVG